MVETFSPMWWTQQFAVWSNVVLWGWIFLALFAPGLYAIKKWAGKANFRFRTKETRARHGRSTAGVAQVAGHTGSHRIIKAKEEAAA